MAHLKAHNPLQIPLSYKISIIDPPAHVTNYEDFSAFERPYLSMFAF